MTWVDDRRTELPRTKLTKLIRLILLAFLSVGIASSTSFAGDLFEHSTIGPATFEPAKSPGHFASPTIPADAPLPPDEPGLLFSDPFIAPLQDPAPIALPSLSGQAAFLPATSTNLSPTSALASQTAPQFPLIASRCDLTPHGSVACDTGAAAGTLAAPSHYVVYEGGWRLRPYDAAKTPFELRFELHNQFRYTLYDGSGLTPPDVNGNRNPISDRNDFDINRGRLVFAGYAFDPDLGFYVNIDYSTVAAESILPLLAWISFRHSDDLSLFFGLGKVPGGWEWQQTSRFTMGADRSLATTFFRPSISAGIWATGAITDNLHYTAFIGDGFNTLTLRADELDTNLAYSAISWWEPLGDFGPGFSDLEQHDTLAVRVGHALTTTKNDSATDLAPGPEQTVIRLTNGTRLVAPNALRPGERVNEFDIWLYAIHAGVKRRGYSLGFEYYLRWLRNLKSDAGGEFGSLFDTGFFVQGGAFVIPDKVELFARGSQVTGEQGTGDEISAGMNWYLFGQRNARATFELTSIDDSPAQQSRTGYVAGGSGTLFRAQLWTFF